MYTMYRGVSDIYVYYVQGSFRYLCILCIGEFPIFMYTMYRGVPDIYVCYVQGSFRYLLQALKVTVDLSPIRFHEMNREIFA